MDEFHFGVHISGEISERPVSHSVSGRVYWSGSRARVTSLPPGNSGTIIYWAFKKGHRGWCLMCVPRAPGSIPKVGCWALWASNMKVSLQLQRWELQAFQKKHRAAAHLFICVTSTDSSCLAEVSGSVGSTVGDPANQGLTCLVSSWHCYVLSKEAGLE